MEFKKEYGETIRFENYQGYFSWRTYSYSLKNGYSEIIDCNAVIGSFIKTDYILWQEMRQVINISENGTERQEAWNFHGFYDADKLSLENFEKVGVDDFVSRILTTISKEIVDYHTLHDVEQKLKQLRMLRNEYYIIKLLPKEYKHEWSVYSFFISGFVCNFFDKKLILVESGCD